MLKKTNLILLVAGLVATVGLVVTGLAALLAFGINVGRVFERRIEHLHSG